jgi:hypothetical protein
MNSTKCGDCAHFEQSHRYRGNKRVDVNYGWCKKRSLYPAQEWDPAQPFDADVQRVPEGSTRSKPFIVIPGDVQADCTHVLRKDGK